ncbi:hypothetical protein KR222_010148, partial [Zaprionus bogoriensis]
KRQATPNPPDPVEPLPASNSKLQRFQQAAICTDSSACSLIAKDMLTLGGGAVDAALAALLCNGLIGMQSMGPGGGMIMNIYVHEQRRAYSILSRELAPRSLSAQNFSVFADAQQLHHSPWSIAVPTELLGYALAHQRFGKLPWQTLVEPTLALCRAGYQLYKHQYDALLLNAELVAEDPLLRHMFIDPNTRHFWPIGSHIQPPQQLCATYERLAEQGAQSFYEGPSLAKLYADLYDMGSPISKADLREARAQLTDSIVVPLDEYDLHLTPPPGSGHILGLIMNILREFRADFAAARQLEPLHIHRIVEAFKFGFVQRWQLDEAADEQLLANLTTSAYASRLAKLIDDARTFDEAEHYGAEGSIEARVEQGTSHISLMHNDDAVSVTSTINFYFGSGRMGTRTGILFNNAMSDFSMAHLPNYFDLPHVHGRNTVRPAARPLSSMCPLIVTERATGRVRLVAGAAGGTKIISALVPLLVRLLWQRDDLKQAVDANRFHHQMLPNVLLYEYGMLQHEVEQLRAKGHRCERYRNRGTVICGVAQNEHGVWASTDYRKAGGVAGL